MILPDGPAVRQHLFLPDRREDLRQNSRDLFLLILCPVYMDMRMRRHFFGVFCRDRALRIAEQIPLYTPDLSRYAPSVDEQFFRFHIMRFRKLFDRGLHGRVHIEQIVFFTVFRESRAGSERNAQHDARALLDQGVHDPVLRRCKAGISLQHENRVLRRRPVPDLFGKQGQFFFRQCIILMQKRKVRSIQQADILQFLF